MVELAIITYNTPTLLLVIMCNCTTLRQPKVYVRLRHAAQLKTVQTSCTSQKCSWLPTTKSVSTVTGIIVASLYTCTNMIQFLQYDFTIQVETADIHDIIFHRTNAAAKPSSSRVIPPPTNKKITGFLQFELCRLKTSHSKDHQTIRI